MNKEIEVIKTLRPYLEKSKSRLQEVAQSNLSADRLIRIMLSACSRNPKLLECSHESIVNFCMKCSETGLEPIGAGGAWPVPYRNKKNNTTEMQFIADYRGLVNCAVRAGCIVEAYADVVRENDTFDYQLGLHPDLIHKPAKTDRGEIIGAYCVYTLPEHIARFVFMDKDEITAIKKRSKAQEDGPWITDESEMCKKTVVRRAMKPFAGRSVALDAAITADDKVTGLKLDEPEIQMPEIIPESVPEDDPLPI